MDTLCTFKHLDRILEIAVIEEEWPIAALPALGKETEPTPAAMTPSPIILSAATIAPHDTLTLSAQVGGPDIAFVYLELLLRDPHREQYYGPVCREPIAAPQTKSIGGVRIPDWSAVPTTRVTIKPFLRLLTDGQVWALGFIKPRTPKTPTAGIGYTLEAMYRSVRDRRKERAQVSFDASGAAKGVLLFRSLEGRTAPQPVNPRRYDWFTPLLQCYRPATRSGLVIEKAVVQSNTLKWSGRLQWQAEPLIPGNYLAGLVAEDLDGQLHRRYAELVIASG